LPRPYWGTRQLNMLSLQGSETILLLPPNLLAHIAQSIHVEENRINLFLDDFEELPNEYHL